MTDIDGLVAALTLEEKADLLAGRDFWSTVAVDRLGIPAVRVTDGPSGARGAGATLPGDFLGPSTCIPCGSAMGATWDPALAEDVGTLVGREARERGCRALLAPTVNLHRAPLAGRNFECYSEDPLLSGKLAAGFVRGVQSNDVIATVKHFVANEQEFERASISAEVDERSLRELYLLPFELAVREGGALGLMTSYNRLNGRWLTEQPRLLLDVVRGEWGFGGLVMTDWFAVADTVASAGAGLDLEMPGGGRAFGPPLAAAVRAGRVDESDVDAAVGRLLHAWDRVGALDGPTPVREDLSQSDADRELLHRAAVGSIVLLVNDGVLPLDVPTLRRIALIGPNADAPRVMGGGSSEVQPFHLGTPLEALRDALPGVEVVHERGAEIDRTARPVGGPGLRAIDGFEVEYFAGPDRAGAPVRRQRIGTLRLMASTPPGPTVTGDAWSARVRGRILPGESGPFRLTLAQNGSARLLVDGVPVLDGFADPPPPGGTDFFGLISRDVDAEVPLEAGTPVDLEVQFRAAGATLPGFRIGFRPPDVGDPVARAVEVAAGADVAVVVVGTTSEWETEGRDRSSFALPGLQDELVRRVAAANPRTVVVVNAGAAVDLPWADDVGAVLQCWFGGEQMASAVSGVLTGADEPGGRLATTVPHRIEHSPSFDNFPGENGRVRYGEGLFVGYRGHEHRAIAPRFPFGHGLGYTTVEIGEPRLSSPSFRSGHRLVVSVPVTNTGPRRGTEVVQCYVAPEHPRLARPPQELKAFAKVDLGPGETQVVDLELDDRSFAYWDPGQTDWEDVRARTGMLVLVDPTTPDERRAPGWQVDPGRYELRIGRSSADTAHRRVVEVVAPD